MAETKKLLTADEFQIKGDGGREHLVIKNQDLVRLVKNAPVKPGSQGWWVQITAGTEG